MHIEFLKQFLKDVSKLNSAQVVQLKSRLELFRRQPHHPLLRNHALKGKLKSFYSINITGDLRAIYKIHSNARGDRVIQFIRLGTHSQLY